MLKETPAMRLAKGLAAAAAVVVVLPLAAADDESETAQGADEAPALEVVTILGVHEETPGVGHVIDAEQLAQFAYADVQRTMRSIPGLAVQVEDGFGLRPNIGIRGVATERSARITLLEDGVLIAPAPYSAPSAYYFPTSGRMAGVEVLKGPAAIAEGPYTIGGAVNFLSTPIPAERSGRVFAELGQHASNRLHATYGGTADSGFGFLLETHQWFSDGFQDVDRGGDSGLDVRDYTLKLAHGSGPHRVHLKLQSADQGSEQSYLGLTDADFRASPYRRYGISQLDRIDTEHRQAIARYEYLGDAFEVAVTGYRNTHARNWFKTEGIDLDGSADAQTLSRVSWASIVQSVNRGTGIRGLSAMDLASILHGTRDTPPGSIQIRANDREYVSQGIQLRTRVERSFGAARHELSLGVRYHEDDEQRLQRNSSYSQRSGALVLDDLGLLGNAGNRIQRAEAIAVFVQDRIEFGAWTLIPGLRFEDIDQSRVRYETRNGRTDDPSSRAASNLRSTRANNTRVLLPGLSALYRIGDSATLVAGVHKGFTAPSNAPGVDAEEALNYELGVRAATGRARLELMGFLSDYDNLLGECTSSSGVECEIGDAFNGDAATVRGLELAAEVDLTAPESRAEALLEVAYTRLDGEFDTDIADTDFFGDVSAGDPLPYIPNQQLHAAVHLNHGRWSASASMNYVDAVCVRASCGSFEKTDDSLVADVLLRFAYRPRSSVFLRLENVADADDLVGRHPYGARPNKGRTATVGVDIGW